MAESGYLVNMKAQNPLKMVRLLLCFLVSWFRSQNGLVLANVALRQHLGIFGYRLLGEEYLHKATSGTLTSPDVYASLYKPTIDLPL
ncbi:MAG: hypothetical protein P9M14_08645 [Candidatus Alcyoniella australis]|nr:hypothetical protein [Candidatus Alcyoniella australis]